MIFLGLGSSIGNAQATFDKTDEFLASKGVFSLKKSKILKNPPFGGVATNDFSNAVWQIGFPQTSWEKFNWILLPKSRKQKLKAYKLLQILQQCENLLGRTREKRWGDRTLDLDILTFHELILDKKRLKLPHPGIKERSFVLIPWQEIVDEGFEIPRFGVLTNLIKSLKKH